MKTHRVLAWTTVVALLTGMATAAEEPESLDNTLLQKAPEILQFLKKQNYKPRDGKPMLYVGVLKFSVLKDGATGKTDKDNVGPLNLTLAYRLETALNLALKGNKIGILERPSAIVAKKSRSANHEWPQGRKALFDVEDFTLPWGTGKESRNLSADVFLTGEARLSADLLSVKVTVKAFDRNHMAEEPLEVTTFTAPTNVRTLVEASHSFHASKGNPPIQAIVTSGKEIEKDPKKHPATFGESPVKMTVLYNGQTMPISTTLDGRAEVAEPTETTKVHIKLHNTSPTDRYGVLLMVNGRNTIFREEKPADECYKWILDPKEELTVQGFQETWGDFKEFEVLPVKQSEQIFRYSQFDGTFHIVVFPENLEAKFVLTEQAFGVLRNDGVDASVLSKINDLKDKKFKTLDDFKAVLKQRLTKEELDYYEAKLLVHADKDKRSETPEEQAVASAPIDPAPNKRPETPAAYQQALKTYGQVSKIGKGMIEAGQLKEGKVTPVQIRFERSPVMSSVIYYYKPGSGKSNP